MRKNNKKGFTLVELVIVIAVIAILAAVLIPTFITVIANANKSAAEQEGSSLQLEIKAVYLGNFDEWCKDVLALSLTEPDTVDGVSKTDSKVTIKKSTKLLFKGLDEYDETELDNIAKFEDIINVKGDITVEQGKWDDKDDASVYIISYETTSGYKVRISATKVEAKQQ